MALESLAPELLTMIMGSVKSFLDLYALISASPCCFRVFSQTSPTVLAAVLRNELGPEVLHHALAVFHAPPTPDYTSKNLHPPQIPDDEARGAFEAKVRQFLEGYFQYSPFPSPTSHDDIVLLARRHRQVNRLVEAYCKRAFSLMQPRRNFEATGQDCPEFTANPPPRLLSSEEQQRLQRAFYRFELFYHVFPPRVEGWNESMAMMEEKSDLFVSQMDPWEVEEINSVHIYLTSAIGDFLDDFEDYLVQKVLSSPAVRMPPARRGETAGADETQVHGATPNHTTQQSSPDDDVVPFRELELYGLQMFSQYMEDIFGSITGSIGVDASSFKNFLLSHGLAWLDQFMQSGFKERMTMVRFQRLATDQTYSEAVIWTQHSELRAARDVSLDHVAGRDQVHRDQVNRHGPLSRPGPGFTRFKREVEDVYLSFWNIDYAHYLLRERGYSFWDSDRLSNPLVEQALLEAQTMPGEVVEYRLMRSARRKSVEVRLQGVLMPRDVREILHEYSADLDSESEEDDD